MRRERILPWLVLASHALVVLLIVLDLLGLATRHAEYAAVHGFDRDRQDWAQRSEGNYVVRNLAIILVAGGASLLSIAALRGVHRADRLLKIYAGCVALFIAYNLTDWWLSGFGWK